MKYWWPLLALLGCNDKVEDAPPCQGWKAEDEDYRPVLELAGPDGESIRIQAVFSRTPRSLDGAPTVVYIQGGWAPVMLPLAENTPTLRDGFGFTTLYMDFPAANFRGAESRAVVAHVLQYAAGEITDTDDCTLDDRVPGGRAPEIILAGFSNGGNLAWATAGDLELEVPRLDGIATFETPSSSQFIMVEPGTRRHPNTRFDLTTCDVVTGPAISCGVDYTPIDFAQHNLCDATARYLVPSKSAQLCISRVTPTTVSAVVFCQPPIFSGSPYLNLTKSPSTQVLSATDSEICLLNPGLNGTFINGINSVLF